MALTLSGCSLPDFTHGKKKDAAATSSTPPPTPPSADGPTAMDTFRALAPPEGMKYTQLFAEPISDPAARAQRLEDSVQSLRNDFDTVVPSMVRLVSVEKDMKELVKQLQTLTDQQPSATAPLEQTPLAAPQNSPAPTPLTSAQPAIPGGDAAGGTEAAGTQKAGTTASPSLVAPEAAPAGQLPPGGAASPSAQAPPPPPKTPVYWAAPNSMAAADMKNRGSPPPPPAQVGAPQAAAPEAVPAQPAAAAGSVRDVRAADHPDKTRVVLDLSGRMDFKVSLVNNNKTLIIEMPQADWSAVKPFDAMSAALVAGWHVEGQQLRLDLLYPSSVKSQTLLPPSGKLPERLVVDLFSKDVHK